jgi:hypothetical protein
MATTGSLAPTRKVGSGAIGGALSVIGLWVFDSMTAVEMPSAVAAAVTLLVTFGVSYLVPPGADEA